MREIEFAAEKQRILLQLELATQSAVSLSAQLADRECTTQSVLSVVQRRYEQELFACKVCLARVGVCGSF